MSGRIIEIVVSFLVSMAVALSIKHTLGFTWDQALLVAILFELCIICVEISR